MRKKALFAAAILAILVFFSSNAGAQEIQDIPAESQLATPETQDTSLVDAPQSQQFCEPFVTGSSASASSSGTITFSLQNDTCKEQMYRIAQYVPDTEDIGDWWGFPHQGQVLRNLSGVKTLPVGNSTVVIDVDSCVRVQVDLLLGSDPSAPTRIHPLGELHGQLLTGTNVNVSAVQFTPSANCSGTTTSTTTSTTSTTTTSTSTTSTTSMPTTTISTTIPSTTTTSMPPTTITTTTPPTTKPPTTTTTSVPDGSKLAYTGISSVLFNIGAAMLAIGALFLLICAHNRPYAIKNVKED